MNINVNKYTAHKGPGKFQGEASGATEYFYELEMNGGDGEHLFTEDENEDFTPVAEVFTINADEAEAFDLPIGHIFLLREDSQGFCYGSVHASREEAQEKFQDWVS